MLWKRVFVGIGVTLLGTAMAVPAQSPGTRPAGVNVQDLEKDPAGVGPRVGVSGELIGFAGHTASGSQTITLVHTGKMQIAVYHIDGSGQIHLVSSRPIDNDFSITLNPTEPLPGQIRPMANRDP
ncbi:MAG: hypothetical protein AAGJ83_07335 [Planctomycetota bacterium]